MVLIDRKFNEEQLLLKTFFPKMHIERDIRTNLGGVSNLHKKATGEGSGGFNMCFGSSFSNIFRTETFAGSFCKFSPHFDLICLHTEKCKIFQSFFTSCTLPHFGTFFRYFRQMVFKVFSIFFKISLDFYAISPMFAVLIQQRARCNRFVVTIQKSAKRRLAGEENSL